MPATYRVEASPNNRAGCKGSPDCKTNGVKLLKGEIRFGTWVEVEGGHASWAWRHWGCVTPVILGNLKESSGGDLDLVDGYEELEDEDQKAKIRRALEQGHVDDEDWKGEVEFNRPGKKGFKTRANKKKKADEVEGNDEQIPKKPKGKKRKAADTEEEDEAPAKKPKGKAKKGAKSEDADVDEEEEVVPVKKSKARGKKATKVKEVEDEDQVKDDDVDHEVDEAPQPAKKGRGRPKKTSADAPPQKKSRAKKT